LRRRLLVEGRGFEWLDTSEDVLGFRHGRMSTFVNFGSLPIELPSRNVVLSSSPGVEDRLPPDTAAWLLEP